MDKRLLGYINWALLACMLLLYFTGVANLYSASGTRVETGFAFESFYQRQLVWGLCGLGCMLLATLFDYRQLRNLAWPAYLIFLVLLMLVPLVGSTFYGAKRWISFGLFTIQPSEPIKIAVLILVARLLARDSQPLGWKNFFSVLAVGLVPVVFILKQFTPVDFIQKRDLCKSIHGTVYGCNPFGRSQCFGLSNVFLR